MVNCQQKRKRYNDGCDKTAQYAVIKPGSIELSCQHHAKDFDAAQLHPVYLAEDPERPQNFAYCPALKLAWNYHGARVNYDEAGNEKLTEAIEAAEVKRMAKDKRAARIAAAKQYKQPALV